MMLHLMLVLVMMLAGVFQGLIIRQATAFSQAVYAACTVQEQILLGEELRAEAIARFLSDKTLFNTLNVRGIMQLNLAPWPSGQKAPYSTYASVYFTKVSDRQYRSVIRLMKKAAPDEQLYTCTVLISYDDRAHTATIDYEV